MRAWRSGPVVAELHLIAGDFHVVQVADGLVFELGLFIENGSDVILALWADVDHPCGCRTVHECLCGLEVDVELVFVFVERLFGRVHPPGDGEGGVEVGIVDGVSSQQLGEQHIVIVMHGGEHEVGGHVDAGGHDSVFGNFFLREGKPALYLKEIVVRVFCQLVVLWVGIDLPGCDVN